MAMTPESRPGAATSVPADAQDGPSDEASGRLGCGRAIDDVWARIGSAPDEHERSCADCQAARASLERLSDATAGMRAQTSTPSAAVKTGVMRVARAEVRRGRTLPVRRTAAGTITLSEQSVAGLVRGLADEVPQIAARRCFVALGADSRTASDGATVLAEEGVGSIDVALGVAVTLGTPIPSVVGALRDRIREQVADRLGVVAARIDITVEDVLLPTEEVDR